MLVTSKQSTAAGLVLEPRLEFLPARTVGAALGGFTHINKANSGVRGFCRVVGRVVAAGRVSRFHHPTTTNPAQ